MSGGRAAALLLVGVLIGGISGGATAAYLTYRAAQSPSQPAINVGLPIATPPPAASGTADEEIVGVVQDLLPSVVTVINYASNGQPQSSGSGFVVDAAKGYVITLTVTKCTRDAAKQVTECWVEGDIARYPQETVKSGAKGNKMFSAGWHGHSKVLGGTSDGDVVFCLEDIAKKMMKDGIAEMKKDFTDR